MIRTVCVYLMIWGFFHAFGAQASTLDNCQTIVGSGRFLSHDDDSLSFVKEMLLYQSFRDVLSKKMTCMGLASDDFWPRFDKAFDEHFAPVEQELRSRSESTRKGKTGAEVVKDKQELEKNVRARQLMAKKKFGNLEKLIKSYSVQKMTRAMNYPNSRFMQVSATIDDSLLKKLFYDYTHSAQYRKFDKVLLSVQFDLQKMQWSDLGVETDKMFRQAVLDSWKKWLTDHWGAFIGDVELASESQIAQLHKFFMLPTDVKGRTVIVESGEKNVEGRSSDNNALWVKLDFTISKEYENDLTGRRDFIFSGQLLVLDLLTGKTAAGYDFVPEKKQYHQEESQSLSSSVATLIYRIPLNEMKTMAKTLSVMTANENVVMLQLKNLNSIKDVFTFINHLENRGGQYQIQAEMDQYTGPTASVKLYFRAAKDKLMEFLSTLREIEFDADRSIGSVASDKPFELTLVDKNKILKKE